MWIFENARLAELSTHLVSGCVGEGKGEDRVKGKLPEPVYRCHSGDAPCWRTLNSSGSNAFGMAENSDLWAWDKLEDWV